LFLLLLTTPPKLQFEPGLSAWKLSGNHFSNPVPDAHHLAVSNYLIQPCKGVAQVTTSASAMQLVDDDKGCSTVKAERKDEI
jgi:hypothetical protein